MDPHADVRLTVLNSKVYNYSQLMQSVSRHQDEEILPHTVHFLS